MAETKVVTLDLQTNINQAEKSVGSLKSQLKEAQNEVAALSEKFGATSAQAVEAAKRAGELKDKIGDAKSLTDAFNPDAKFKSLTASLSGAAGGLAAVTGAYGLLGGKSKEVEGMILKVQSAMAISSGLQAVGESIDSFKQLRAVVQSYTIVQKLTTAAQWLWNAATSANPLGALVLVITAVIAAGYKLVSFFIESAAANDAAMAATKRNTSAMKDQQKASKSSVDTLKEHNDQQYAMAKAGGASSEALRKLAVKHADEAVALNHKNTMLARSTFLRNADTLAALKANDASDEAIAAQEKLVKSSYEAFDKQREGLYSSYKDRRKVINDNEVAIVQERTDRNKKEVTTTKQHTDDVGKIKEDAAKKLADKQKEAFESEKKVVEDQLKNTKISVDEKRNIVLNDNKLSKEDRQKFLIDLQNQEILAEENHNKAIADLNKKYDDEKANRLADTAVKKEQLDYEKSIAEINNIAQTELEKQTLIEKLDGEHKVRLATATKTDAEKKLADAKLIADAELKIQELKQEGQRVLLGKSAEVLGAFSDMLGKETAEGKTLAIAQATINAYLGISEVWKAKNVYPEPFGTGIKIASTVVMAASAFKTVKDIAAVQVPGGGGGGASTPSMGVGASAPAAPSFNVVGNSGVNQVANVLQNQGMAPIKTYVTAGEVTTQQGLNRNIVSNATLG
jgi:hypothetical protein